MVPGDLDFPLPSLRFVPLKALVLPERLADPGSPSGSSTRLVTVC